MPQNKKSGFALVIALGLMSFVLLLLLSITTLVQVESANAEISKSRLLAQQNAQLGAMIALGKLQQLTGPDQRVTARADILVAPDATAYTGTAFWTGVWSSKDDEDDANDQLVLLDGRRPQWLVSGDLSSFVDQDNHLSADIEGDSVITIASLDKSVGSVTQEVVVPKESIEGLNSQVNGEYAFWVSDEGVKARVNLPRPLETDQITEEQLRFYEASLVQQGDASTARNTDQDTPYGGGSSLWKRADTDVGKALTPYTLPMLTSSADDALRRDFFHDFTTFSSSVLANVKDGGLKRDLSTALLNLLR